NEVEMGLGGSCRPYGSRRDGGIALATPPSRVTTTTFGVARFDNIDATTKTDVNSGDPTDFWQARINTKGASDLYVLQNTIAPGGSTSPLPLTAFLKVETSSAPWRTRPVQSRPHKRKERKEDHAEDAEEARTRAHRDRRSRGRRNACGRGSRVARFRKRHDAARREGRLQRDRPPEQRPDQVPDKASDRRSYSDDHIRPRRLQRLASRPGLRTRDG